MIKTRLNVLFFSCIILEIAVQLNRTYIREKINNEGGCMVKKIIKDTIHAKGLDIAIYTEDFKDEFLIHSRAIKKNNLAKNSSLSYPKIPLKPNRIIYYRKAVLR